MTGFTCYSCVLESIEESRKVYLVSMVIWGYTPLTYYSQLSVVEEKQVQSFQALGNAIIKRAGEYITTREKRESKKG